MTNEERLDNIERRLDRLESKPASERVDKKLSLQELVKKLKPSSQIDTVLIAGYYLEQYEEVDCFNAEDILSVIRRAKISPPTNPNDATNKNVSKGHMMTHEKFKDGKKSWVLTLTGEDYVSKLGETK